MGIKNGTRLVKNDDINVGETNSNSNNNNNNMTKYYLGDQIQKNWMGDVCCTCGGRGEGYTVF